ncbi:MAG: type II toxin-antitoxin system MqsA family antitoxin [Rubrivivax sp.]|nr:type II toxin-antitoxin system MqsA family antitoxin [Rubrivivax sp.]
MRCRSDACRVDHKSAVVDFKGLTLEVDGLAETVCTACSYSWETAGQQLDNLAVLRNAFVARRDEVRREEGLLTGEQVDHVLSKLELSRHEAASIFGGGPNAFQKYVSGDVLQSKAMDRLLRLTLAFGHPAVSYLRKGSSAPLALYAGSFLLTQSDLEPATVSGAGVEVDAQKAPAFAVRNTSASTVFQ